MQDEWINSKARKGHQEEDTTTTKICVRQNYVIVRSMESISQHYPRMTFAIDVKFEEP